MGTENRSDRRLIMRVPMKSARVPHAGSPYAEGFQFVPRRNSETGMPPNACRPTHARKMKMPMRNATVKAAVAANG
jgi:hypothetical protein